MESKFPFGLDFQNKVVNVMLTDKRFLGSHRDLIKAGYFENDNLARLVKMILEFYDVYGQIPSKESVSELVRDSDEVKLFETIVDKVLSTSIEDADFISSEVVDFIKQQEIRRSFSKALSYIKERNFDDAQQVVLDAFRIGTDVEDLGVDFFSSYKDILMSDLLNEDSHKRIATLIPEVDDVLGGGVYPGELNVLLGPPKRGKSIWLLNMANAALWQKKKVLYITMELYENKIAAREISRIAGVPTRELLSSFDEVCKKVDDFHRKYEGHLILKKYPMGSPTVHTFSNYINSLITTRKFYPDLLIVDYLDVMRPTKARGDEYEDQGQVAIDLRGLACEYNMCLWTATQGSRSSYNKDVLSPEDIADSWKKAMAVDVMMGLMQTEEEANLNKARLAMMLLRDADNSEKRVIPVTFNKKKMLIAGARSD